MPRTNREIRSVHIDPNACIRCWACCQSAPSVFLCPGRDGALPLLTPKADWNRSELDEAVACCPSAAIEVQCEDTVTCSDGVC